MTILAGIPFKLDQWDMKIVLLVWDFSSLVSLVDKFSDLLEIYVIQVLMT